MIVTLLLVALIPGGLAEAPMTLGVPDASLCEASGVETALFDFKVGFHNCSGIPCSSCEWCCEEACPWGDPCLGNCWYDCEANCY